MRVWRFCLLTLRNKMFIPTKNLLSGFSIPVFGIGTWQMGGRKEHDPGNDDGRDIAAIRAALDAGITHIDTAEVYAAGYAEQLVAQALQGYDRTKIFLVSKVHADHLRHDDVIRSCEASLRRLQTDYLDLYLIHRPNPAIPLQETMAAMSELKDRGLIRAIGLSNATKEILVQAQQLTPHKIVCNQVHYNLLIREPEATGLLPYCQQNDVLLVAYRPLQKGEFVINPPDVLVRIAEKYKKTTAQVAINWLVSQKNVATIVKTSSLAHLQENLGALGWAMDEEDIELLRGEFPDQQMVSDVGLQPMRLVA